MTSARKGLKRIGMAAYEIAGPICTMIIRRNGPRCYLIGQSNRTMTPGFFTLSAKRLRDARACAERLAGIKL